MLAGIIVVYAGYGAAFVALAAVNAVGLALYLFLMPETLGYQPTMAQGSRSTSALAAE
jgi:hypothetical protein